MVKANPYVYPFIPFKDLSNKKIIDNFVSKKNIGISDIKTILAGQELLIQFNKKDLAERIMEIFLSEEVCFGSKDMIMENYQEWIEKLNFFINQNKQIEFSILGFPFKIPVLLKTNRVLPDLGEFLSLNRLNNIMNLISDLYEPGARAAVFTEGVFGKFVGVVDIDADNYRDYLIKYAKEFNLYRLEIKDLRILEEYVPEFNNEFINTKKELLDLFDKKDEEFMKKYNGTFPSVQRIINTKSYNMNTLMDVYNDELSDEEISDDVKKIRDMIMKKNHEVIFNYHAYLQTRSNFDAINKYSEGIITLSVSPKINRLGIYPINNKIERLPYHGVPVWHKEEEEFSIEYLIDIRRSQEEYELVFLEDDEDKEPFYYIEK